jgi:phosphatidylglycerol:prolipoprotein diacylglycerol transferase
MSVYPFVFHIGPIEVTGYGLMMMMGFLMAGWVIQRRLRERELNEGYAADIVVAAVIGGILGAKLWYVALYGDAGALLSRGGLVWYGGLIGGAAAVLINSQRRRVPLRFTLELAAPGLAIGYALGRVGCFLVQDDYGIPTSLPLGLRFPEGLPPSTAYNLSTPVFGILWRLRRHGHGTGWLFGLYLVLAGLERFLVEFVRVKDDRLVSAFTLAQATSLAAMILGVVLMIRWGERDQLPIPSNAGVLEPSRSSPS